MPPVLSQPVSRATKARQHLQPVLSVDFLVSVLGAMSEGVMVKWKESKARVLFFTLVKPGIHV